MEKINKKTREKIIEGMKKVINVKKDVDLATHLGIIPQIISAFKSHGVASFYKKIFEFCLEHRALFGVPVNDAGKMHIEAAFKPVSTAEGIPFCTQEELKYVNMVLDVLRGDNEQDKNSLMSNITSFHRHCRERMAIDQGYLEDLKKNIRKQEGGGFKKAQDC
jgi:hypothetical protein